MDRSDRGDIVWENIVDWMLSQGRLRAEVERRIF